MGVGVGCHPVAVGGAVDGWDRDVGHPAAPEPAAPRAVGGQHKVEVFSCSSSAPTSSSLLLLLQVGVVQRLQLKGEGGVNGDHAPERETDR